MLTAREKSPLPEKFSLGEYRTHDAASSRTASPTHYQRAVPAPTLCECCLNMGTAIITLTWHCHVLAVEMVRTDDGVVVVVVQNQPQSM